MKDRYSREIDYLRISVTENCNLRCRYCMPDGCVCVPENALGAGGIVEAAAAALSLGITQFRITGGEPLVRPDTPDIVRRIRALQGVKSVTLTTNGVLLEKKLPALLDAGLSGVNISLDTLDPDVYREVTGSGLLPAVLSSLSAAIDSGIRVKTNAVLMKGVNGDAWRDLVLLAKDRPVDVRFIELMPIGYGKREIRVPNSTVIGALKAAYPDISPDPAFHGPGPAVYYRVPGWRGSIGFISAIHGSFCSGCSRLRLTADGFLKPCLCFGEMLDLKPALSLPDPEKRREALSSLFREAIMRKPEHHEFLEPGSVSETRLMSEIGG